MLKDELAKSCAATDQPIAGLLTDLKQRGLLQGHAGRLGRRVRPHARTPRAATAATTTTRATRSGWPAAACKGGLAYGATDDFGYEAVENPVHIHDWHATILHLLGLDHERLTFNYAGRDFRLTDVYGSVVTDLMA